MPTTASISSTAGAPDSSGKAEPGRSGTARGAMLELYPMTPVARRRVVVGETTGPLMGEGRAASSSVERFNSLVSRSTTTSSCGRARATNTPVVAPVDDVIVRADKSRTVATLRSAVSTKTRLPITIRNAENPSTATTAALSVVRLRPVAGRSSASNQSSVWGA